MTFILVFAIAIILLFPIWWEITKRTGLQQAEDWKRFQEENPAWFMKKETPVRENKDLRACPCRYTTPCHKRCSCVTPASSVGCNRCCTYGSVEQRTARAIEIADKLK